MRITNRQHRSRTRVPAVQGLGPSGAGKSTTQNVLIRLLDGYEGKVAVLGKDLRAWDRGYYRRIGVAFEAPNHYLKLTARENLQLFAGLHGGGTEDPDALQERALLLSLPESARANSALWVPAMLVIDLQITTFFFVAGLIV